MESNTIKEARARRVVMITGLFPTIPCWMVVFTGRFTWESVPGLLGLVTATILSSILVIRFRHKNFNWIYYERPVFGSFVSMLVHMLSGYVALAGTPAICFLLTGDFSSAGASLIFGLFAGAIALPGAVVGFYVNAHALIYIKSASLILKTDDQS